MLRFVSIMKWCPLRPWDEPGRVGDNFSAANKMAARRSEPELKRSFEALLFTSGETEMEGNGDSLPVQT